MSLNQSLSKAIECIMQALPAYRSFSRLKSSAPVVCRYVDTTAWYQREVCFYRDKWWNKEGGKLYVELYCLVNDVQLLLSGKPQQLAKPDYAIPLKSFQYRVASDSGHGEWSIHSMEDVAAFESKVTSWLEERALSWFEQFTSMPGVIQYMQSFGYWHSLALLQAARGERAEAEAAMLAWLHTLPRQIDAPLDELTRANLLSVEAHKMLSRAALQEESRYRSAVEQWMTDSY
jgi:hypothetical protein